MVGVTGFEPMTSRPPGVRATKLRQTPLSPLRHVPRPQNFTIESVAFIGRFPCNAPLAHFTPAQRATNCATSRCRMKKEILRWPRKMSSPRNRKVGARNHNPRVMVYRIPFHQVLGKHDPRLNRRILLL